MLGGVSSTLLGRKEVWPDWNSGCLGVHVGEGQSLGLSAPAKDGQEEDTSDLSSRRAGLSLRSVCIPRAPQGAGPEERAHGSGLGCVSHNVPCGSADPQHLRMRLYLEIGPLKRWRS